MTGPLRPQGPGGFQILIQVSRIKLESTLAAGVR